MPYEPGGAPFVDNVQNPETARALMESKKLEDWFAKLDHKTNAVATSFSASISKCQKYGLVKAFKAYCWIAINRTSINSRRALLVSQTAMGIGVPGFYDKGSSGKPRSGKDKGNNENT